MNIRKAKRGMLAYPPACFFVALRAATAASEAFFARAARSSRVIVSRERFPPIFPPLAPCLRKKSSTSGGSLFAMA